MNMEFFQVRCIPEDGSKLNYRRTLATFGWNGALYKEVHKGPEWGEIPGEVAPNKLELA